MLVINAEILILKVFAINAIAITGMHVSNVVLIILLYDVVALWTMKVILVHLGLREITFHLLLTTLLIDKTQKEVVSKDNL